MLAHAISVRVISIRRYLEPNCYKWKENIEWLVFVVLHVLGILYRVGVVLLRSAAVSPSHDSRRWRPLPSSPVVPPWTPWRLWTAAWLRGRKRDARSGRDGVKTFKTRRRPSKTLWVPAAKPMSLLKKCCCLTSLHVMSQQIQYQRLIIMNKTVKTLLVRWDYSLRKWNVVKVNTHHNYGINKRSYHRTGLNTIRSLIKTGSKILRTGTEAKFWPFVDSLIQPFTG